MPAATGDVRATVVVATRDRVALLARTLERLVALPERPPVVVVDNGSRDGSAGLAGTYPGVGVVRIDRNVAAAARNAGVRAAQTPYVAFADDDSWWAAGALRRAADHLDRHPALGLVAARVLVEPGGRLDPVSRAMRAAPLGHDPALPGPHALGFLACAAVVRRRAHLAAGGFHPRLAIGGEEELLAADLAAAGWSLVYADDVVAHHHPAPGPRPGRALTERRNRCWSAWLRRPLPAALAVTASAAGAAPGSTAAGGMAAAVAGLPWVLGERRRAPAHVERALRALGGTGGGPGRGGRVA